jgi:hypothetical protein
MDLLRRLLMQHHQKAPDVAKKRPTVARSVHWNGKYQLQHARFVKSKSGDIEFYGEAVYGEAFFGEATCGEALPGSPDESAEAKAREIFSLVFLLWLLGLLGSIKKGALSPTRPPVNAEYLLYLFLGKEEREAVIGDLVEEYGTIKLRFNKQCADIWYYKQVAGSLLPLLRRALLRIGAVVWLGRILRRLIS